MTSAQVAVLGTTRAGSPARAPSTPSAERPLFRWVTFAALGLYGISRWGTLLKPAPTTRLLGLLALALAIAGAGGMLVRFNRRLAVLGAVLALLATMAIAGVPVGWMWHLRIAVTAGRIGDGLTAVPQINVPYLGGATWVQTVILLGAGVLLLAAALLLAFAPRSAGDGWRAASALPLMALAIVPAALVKPSLPYLQGLILFALLATFVWGERIRPGGAPTAVAIAALAGVAGAVVAPGLDQHKPWLNFEALGGKLAAVHAETFTWQQQYGPLHWPRTGHEVIDVNAAHPEYWKAENLDIFNGYGWAQGSVQSDESIPQAASGPLSQWTQTIQVTIRGMNTTDVIAAGMAAAPQHLAGQILSGASPGTWGRATPLSPGDSYTVSVYTPSPTATELQQAGNQYPAGLSDYRSLALPGVTLSGGGVQIPGSTIVFAPFHSSALPKTVDGGNATRIARSSPYGRAYALAQSLEGQARTPADYIQAVLAYLHHGFTYDENPPRARFPLESFLFSSRRGYCQQFSGAMALLLRMGGIPARVSAGFTTGTYDPTKHQWVVSDIDAHDWVEAWFPRFGWVRFDPTPASAPARSAASILPALRGTGATVAKAPAPVRRPDVTPASSQPSVVHHRGGGSDALLIIGLIVAFAVLLLAARVGLRTREPTTEELLIELERALRRCKRPVGLGVTLAELEQRFRSSPEAMDYIRSLRLSRFAGHGGPPTLEQRRALRAQLAAGLGFSGTVRAIWALPPRCYLPSSWVSLCRSGHRLPGA